MAEHILVLTVDTDPDALSTQHPDRRTLTWEGLDFAIAHFHAALPEWVFTWYVRADGQLEHAYGNTQYLLDTHADFWRKAVAHGDELGWHPHLYTVPADDSVMPDIITDSRQATDALYRIWADLQTADFEFASFRMGEGWHTAQTLNTVESFGFTIDSTCIPERDDSATGHPRNWAGAPNQPYYPAQDSPRKIGDPRPLLEIPMNSWVFKTSYDTAPKQRYMNPCIHPELWQQALSNWQASLPNADNDTYIWTMILHPNEALPHDEADLLYAYSLDAVRDNLNRLVDTIQARGDSVRIMTMAQAANVWRT
ncbi:MAG: hypothetical protein AAF126_13660 [Chloroflexota bacterium]